ncbi:MAG: alpha/beta hydrolase, partial [Planctomycetota bacterium]
AVPIEDGVVLHYTERGTGEPIIFVHGLSSDLSFWSRQVEEFAKKGYRAIAYSRRYNHPNDNELRPDHSAIVEAADLARFIKKLDLEQAHVVGFSYGALTALVLALDHPELVRSVTLAEPPIVSWLDDLPGDNAGAGKAHRKKLMNEGIRPTKMAFDSGNEEKAMRTMMDCIGGKGTFDAFPEFVKMKCRQNVREMIAIVSSKAPYPDIDRERVRKLAVPTLILSGRDTVATAKWTDPELERLVPERFRKRVVLDGASHIMWVQRPVQSRNAVLAFLQGK